MLALERPLALLLLVPAVVLVVYTHTRSFARVYLNRYRFTNPLVRFVSKSVKHRRHVTLALKLALASMIILALAGPYYVEQREVVMSSEIEEVGVLRGARPLALVALDVSGSMSEQFVGGRKIDAAKNAIRQFLSSLPSEFEVGLIAFSHRIVAAAPPTASREKVLSVLERLEPGGGTVYTYPLETALSWIRPYRAFNASAIVVFVTDGMPSDPQYRDLLNEYVLIKVPVYTVYIGSPGEPGEKETAFIAERTGARQYTASSAKELAESLKDIAARASRIRVKVEARVTIKRIVKVKVLLTPYVSAACLLLLALLWVARYKCSGLTF